MRMFFLLLNCSLVIVFSLSASAETATDRLLGKIIDKQVPFMLHEATDQPWTGGTYAIRIYRDGRPGFRSNTKNMIVSLPLRAEMVGNAGLLNAPITCRAEFKTLLQVNVLPDFSANPVTTRSSVQLPIPPVMANCDVIQFPVEAFIEQMVAKNKTRWEQDIDKALNTELKKLSL